MFNSDLEKRVARLERSLSNDTEIIYGYSGCRGVTKMPVKIAFLMLLDHLGLKLTTDPEKTNSDVIGHG